MRCCGDELKVRTGGIQVYIQEVNRDQGGRASHEGRAILRRDGARASTPQINITCIGKTEDIFWVGLDRKDDEWNLQVSI